MMDLQLLRNLTQRYKNIAGKEDDPTHSKRNAVLEEIQLYLENYLKVNPTNTEIILRLAIVLYLLHAEDLAVSYLDSIPSTNTFYAKSLLLRTWIQESWYPFDEQAYNNLILASQQEKDSEIKSMLLYCASRYCNLTFDQQRDLLSQSIKLCDKHTNNISDLATLPPKVGEGIDTSLILNAMRNIVEVSDCYTTDDITNPDEFIDIYIKGINTTRYRLSRFIDYIDPERLKKNW